MKSGKSMKIVQLQCKISNIQYNKQIKSQNRQAILTLCEKSLIQNAPKALWIQWILFLYLVVAGVETFHHFIGDVKIRIDIESGSFLEDSIVAAGLVVVLDESRD